jgi:hypothetical protein
MPSSRQLVAIMFTDMAGYTALMGENEQKAFEILRKEPANTGNVVLVRQMFRRG